LILLFIGVSSCVRVSVCVCQQKKIWKTTDQKVA